MHFQETFIWYNSGVIGKILSWIFMEFPKGSFRIYCILLFFADIYQIEAKKFVSYQKISHNIDLHGFQTSTGPKLN